MENFNIQNDNDDIQTSLLISQFYQSIEDREYQTAISIYLKITNNEISCENHTILAWLYYQMEEYEKALDNCIEAISIDSTFGNAFNILGSIYFMITPKDTHTIIDCYMNAITAQNYSPELSRANAFCNLALFYENSGKFTDALQYYTKGYLLDNANMRAENGRYKMLSLLN